MTRRSWDTYDDMDRREDTMKTWKHEVYASHRNRNKTELRID